MAVSATLSTTFKADISLAGGKSISEVQEIPQMCKVFDRTLFVDTAAFTTEVTIGTESFNGLTDYEFLYIENLDTVNPVFVAFSRDAGGGNTEFYTITLPAGRFYQLWNKSFSASDTSCDSPDTDIEVISFKFKTHKGTVRIAAFNS